MYRTFQPSPLLQPFVRFYWQYEGAGSVHKPYYHRSMADSGVEFIFHYKGQFTPEGHTEVDPNILLYGPNLTPRRFCTTEEFGIFGVYMHPFAVQQLFNIPTSEIACHHAEPMQIGLPQDFLEDEMFGTHTVSDRISIIESFLSSYLIHIDDDGVRMQHLIRSLEDRPARMTLKNLATEVHLSTRSFQRKFKSLTGFSIKTYLRLVRYRRAIQLLHKPECQLASVAYQAGYYDQSHFIHDFRALTGLSPGVYHRQQTNDLGYLDTGS